MENSGFIVLLVIFILFVGLYYVKYHFEEVEAIRKENARQKLFDFYESRIEIIEAATNIFNEYLDFKTGYFSYYQLKIWIDRYKNLYDEIKEIPFKGIHLSISKVNAIREFNEYFSNAHSLRNNFNSSFLKEELKLYNNFFNNIEQRSLDSQQRISIITDEDNNIVIAGAGSGKTTTIVGKVNYIIDRYKVNPCEILLISFTNKSAMTLANRINIKEVEAKTFHKFGKDIIAEYEGKQPSIFDENQFYSLLNKYFIECLKDEQYLKLVTEYFVNFLKPIKSPFEFENQGSYIQYIKDQNFRSYKEIEIISKGKKTYNMEIVKSIEECRIANFLLFNGIEYEYELPYEYDTADKEYRQYKPDFTIKYNGKRYYIEHLAISIEGNVPKFFIKEGGTYEQAKNRYWEKIRWARNIHQLNKTLLIETYSYEMNQDILFDNLTKKLNAIGILLHPKSAQEIWQIINKVAGDEVKNLVKLFGTFINLMKSNNYSILDISNRNRNNQDVFLRKRNSGFIDIINPIYLKYEKYLKDRNEIDFSDMINKASNLILQKRYKRNFKYIIIDEFQDISIGRYQLIKALKAINPESKLFAVGDDWQSIYRFSGSDITLFKEFEKYFGFTEKSKIETTYRFYNPLINLSSDFIQKNPNQAKKELRGVSIHKKTNYKICYSNTENQDDTFALQNILKNLLITDNNLIQKEILILGRYSFDIERLKNENRLLHIDKDNGTISYTIRIQGEGIKRVTAQFMTVHKAKGLEADIVIILNCNSGKHGFPSEMSDDPVLNLLLSEDDQFENGEERRLFYVAMTRAKECVYFIADELYKSKFIAELETENNLSVNKKCPFCKTADIVLKKSGIAINGNFYKFYGCTNFLYGCDYTFTEWINN